jgi:hypothetical protein
MASRKSRKSRKNRKQNNLLFLYFFVFTGSLLLKGQNISFSFSTVLHDEVSIRFTYGIKITALVDYE